MCQCNGTGIAKVITGSMMFTRSCTCDVAELNREKADRELRELLEESKRDQAARLRELMQHA